MAPTRMECFVALGTSLVLLCLFWPSQVNMDEVLLEVAALRSKGNAAFPQQGTAQVSDVELAGLVALMKAVHFNARSQGPRSGFSRRTGLAWATSATRTRSRSATGSTFFASFSLTRWPAATASARRPFCAKWASTLGTVLASSSLPPALAPSWSFSTP